MTTKKFGNSNQRHAYYLEELVRNLGTVGESVRDIAWIMHEGIWMAEKSSVYNSLCDLVVAYEDFSINLIELKGSKNKRGKALKQLASGCEFVQYHLPSYDVNKLKIVYYTHDKYHYEDYDKDGTRIKPPTRR